MSIRQIRDELDDDFLDAHADEATHFFGSWLPNLQGFERMAAADWVGTQYVLSMVHVDHAYGMGARIAVEGLAEVTRATAEALEAFRVFTDGPDAEVPESVADRFDRLAATVRTVHDEVEAVLTSLPPHPGSA